MEAASVQQVLAFLCDQHGNVLRILRDDYSSGLAEGRFWIALIDPTCIMKALNFQRDVNEKSAVYDWQITFRVNDQPVPLHCAGGRLDEWILIVASSSPGTDLFYEAEMAKILNEYSKLLRSQMRSHTASEHTYYEEIARLNDELITIQRELARRNAELGEKTRFIERIFEAVPNLLLVYDLREQRLIFANREIIVTLGYTPAEIQKMGSSFLRQLLHPDDVTTLEEHNQRMLLLPDKQTLEIEYRLQDASGEWRWISSRDTIFARDEFGIPTQILSAAQDVTDRKRVQEELWYLSTHDALTGLYNRGYFYEEMGRIEKSRAYPISILLADLDDLKKTNDTMGHTAGDDLLRRAAGLLRSCFRPAEVIARVGGDEFAVLLDHTGYSTAQAIIDRIRRSLEAERSIYPEGPILGLSVGVATAETPMTLLEVYKRADSQMYADKVNRKQTGRLGGED